MAEAVEADIANGKTVDATNFVALTNALRRVLNDVGLVWPANVRAKF
jgi:hypothetical protein